METFVRYISLSLSKMRDLVEYENSIFRLHPDYKLFFFKIEGHVKRCDYIYLGNSHQKRNNRSRIVLFVDKVSSSLVSKLIPFFCSQMVFEVKGLKVELVSISAKSLTVFWEMLNDSFVRDYSHACCNYID